MEENKEYTPTHSYDEVMKAIMKLPENKKKFLLNNFNLEQIVSVMGSEDTFISNIDTCQEYAYAWVFIGNILSDLYELVNTPDDASDNVINAYDKMDILQKKETALKLLNNSDFQRDCSDILVNDMERIAKSNPTLKAFDDMIGITKYLKRCVRLGIGTEHKYEV